MTHVILFGAKMTSIIIVRLVILVYFCANVAGKGAFFCSFFGILCATPTALQPQAEETNNTKTVNYKLHKTLRIECVSNSPYHNWYQAYRNEHLPITINIGNIHFNKDVGKRKATQFILTVEAFDNDSEIYCYNKKNEKTKHIWNLHVTGKHTDKEMEAYDILRYNEKHNVSSEYLKSCESYNNSIFLGVINTISNQIKIYNMKKVPSKFDKTHNGSILCCIYYRVQTNKTDGWITRYVEKKTLLVYDVIDQQADSWEDTEKRFEGISSESTTEDAKGTDAGTRNHDANLDSQQAKPGNQIAGSSKTFIIYIVSAVAGVLMLPVIVIITKRCHKKPKSKEQEEPRVLYAELDLLRQHETGSSRIEGPEEESPYAEIIGEIRP